MVLRKERICTSLDRQTPCSMDCCKKDHGEKLKKSEDVRTGPHDQGVACFLRVT
jgi:hypothetical protein